MAKGKQQYRHPKSLCVFCDNEANSEEHVYPQWAKELLTDKFPYRIHSLDLRMDRYEGKRQVMVRSKTGDPRGSPLKVVCTECNPNWMSRLQEANKDLIIGLGNGSKSSLDSAEQQSLARWAVMTAMVLETQHPEVSLSDKDSRICFAKTGDIPPGWEVFVHG
jgi:hypothetical protein